MSDFPETTAYHAARAKKETRLAKYFAAFAFGLAVLAILLLLGVVVLFFVREFGNMEVGLFLLLLGVFGVGTVLSAVTAFALAKASGSAEHRRDDHLELAEGEESFLVGDGTFATFTEDALMLHAAENSVTIPYADIRFYSVCTRTRPREKGEWVVVLEVPAHYIVRKGHGESDPPSVFIETRYKPRLTAALEAHALPLLGEKPGAKEKKFDLDEKFYLPDPKRRRQALISMVLFAVIAAVGVAVAFFQFSVGAVLAAIGLFFVLRQSVVWMRARALFAVGADGIFWREAGRGESFFLKWEEMEKISCQNGILTIRCTCGAYSLPLIDGAWEIVEKYAGEKVTDDI